MANGLTTPAGVSGLDADQLAILLGVKGHCERLLDHTPRFKYFTLHGSAHLNSLFKILELLQKGGINLGKDQLFVLAIAVDSNYELRQPEDFDLCIAITSVLRHFQSEASERHIQFKRDFPDRPVFVWGEKSAVMQAVGQLISNAIKYSFGGNNVTVSVSERRDDILIQVSEKGIPLPDDPELKQIWDFGFRGKSAKDRHVNVEVGLVCIRSRKSSLRTMVGLMQVIKMVSLTFLFIYQQKLC